MRKAMDIINEAYHKAGGVGEYETHTMSCDKKLPTTIKDFLGVKGRKNIRIATKDIDIIVFEYRETKNPLLFEALIEHYIDILIKNSKRYINIPSGIKHKFEDSFEYDDDLLNEGIIVLNKCINQYNNNYENPSFTSYFLGEYKNHIPTNMCLKQYFPVAKIPCSIYKQHRKKIKDNNDPNLLGTETGLLQSSGGCITDSDENKDYEEFLEQREDNPIKYYDDYEDQKKSILTIFSNTLTEEEEYLFRASYGIFADKIKGVDLSKQLGISCPAVSKKLKKIKEKLSKSEEIIELLNFYKENHLLENIK